MRDDISVQECRAPPSFILPSGPSVDRLPLIREAFRLEWLTIGWMTVEAVVAIAAGITAGSLVLVAFGLDSVIELGVGRRSHMAAIRRLRHGQKFSERAEHIASRIGGSLLFLLAAYIMVAALATMEGNRRRIFMAKIPRIYRRANRNSGHALLGASQDRHRRKDRQPGGSDGRTDDAFLLQAAHELDHRFGIHHATMQVETGEQECRLALANVVRAMVLLGAHAVAFIK